MKTDARKRPEWVRVVRVFEDGLREMEFSTGRRYRTYFRRCPECQEEKEDAAFMAGEKLCSPCQLSASRSAAERFGVWWQEKYGAQHESQRKVRAAAIAAEASGRRYLAIIAATPKWVDKNAISEIYAEARARTAAEGIVYHVDHVWPISHPDCCGLHVPWNLAVISAAENFGKSNALVDGRKARRVRRLTSVRQIS